jgi:23S rRNA maturation mini-RNase III
VSESNTTLNKQKKQIIEFQAQAKVIKELKDKNKLIEQEITTSKSNHNNTQAKSIKILKDPIVKIKN